MPEAATDIDIVITVYYIYICDRWKYARVFCIYEIKHKVRLMRSFCCTFGTHDSRMLQKNLKWRGWPGGGRGWLNHTHVGECRIVGREGLCLCAVPVKSEVEITTPRQKERATIITLFLSSQRAGRERGGGVGLVLVRVPACQPQLLANTHTHIYTLFIYLSIYI